MSFLMTVEVWCLFLTTIIELSEVFMKYIDRKFIRE